MANTKNKGVATRSFQFQLTNDLPEAGVLVASISTLDTAPVTIVLDNKGRKSAPGDVSDRVNRGEQVLALDLLFRAEVVTKEPGVPDFAQLLSAVGPASGHSGGAV